MSKNFSKELCGKNCQQNSVRDYATNSVSDYATKFSKELCYKIQQGFMFNFD